MLGPARVSFTADLRARRDAQLDDHQDLNLYLNGEFSTEQQKSGSCATLMNRRRSETCSSSGHQVHGWSCTEDVHLVWSKVVGAFGCRRTPRGV